jgi:hypothetical protein
LVVLENEMLPTSKYKPWITLRNKWVMRYFEEKIARTLWSLPLVTFGSSNLKTITIIFGNSASCRTFIPINAILQPFQMFKCPTDNGSSKSFG